MHPASSIIIFTALSGMGFGALFWIALLGERLDSPLSALFVAGALVVAGLCSSTLHIRKKARIWRAFTQWQSSWLSREALIAVITGVPALWVLWAAWQGESAAMLARALLAIGAMSTVYCTAMIYASLRAVHEWYTPRTVAVYIIASAFGGHLVVSLFTPLSWRYAVITAVLAIVWLVVRMQWYQHAKRTPISSPETATGLGQFGKVSQLAPPHTGNNYLLNEMGFQVARQRRTALQRIVAICLLALPVALAVIAILVQSSALLALAVVVHLLGALADRWLFFALARHAVMNFYGGHAS